MPTVKNNCSRLHEARRQRKEDESTHHCIVYYPIQFLPRLVKRKCVVFAIDELHELAVILPNFNRFA